MGSSRYKLILLLLSLLIGTLSGVTEAATKEYSFPVGSFKVLKIQDNVNVVYHCNPDAKPIMKYTAEPEFDDAFIITNSGNILKIQVNTEDVGKPGLPTIHIYGGKLKKVENYSDFDLTVSDPCDTQDFVADLIGNGTITVTGLKADILTARVTAGNGSITISGSADKALFRMTGRGHINAENLKTKDVNCKIFGGGSIICGPENSLKCMGIGSTKIHYHGSPRIIHKGGGSLISLDNPPAE